MGFILNLVTDFLGVLGCGSSSIGRITCMGWLGLMDGIKIVVLSI
jgi:hypothetical protein